MWSAPLAVLLLAALTARVAAAPGSRLVIEGELPCSHDELAEALSLRVGDAAVAVRADGDQVRVEIGGLDQLVDLKGARGRAAARRIAVAAAELALPALPSDPPPHYGAMHHSEVRDEGVAASPRKRARMSLGGRVGSEAAPRGALMIGAEIGHGSARLALDAGLAVGGSSDVMLVGVPVRAGIALGDDLSIRIAAIALPYRVDAGAGDHDVLVGGGLEAVSRTRVGGVDVVYLFGFDAYVNQVEYRMDGEAVVTTPRVALWTGVGVTWEAGW